MTTSKTESKSKRILKMVPCVESRLNARPAPKRKAKTGAGSVPADPAYLKPNVLQMMTMDQAKALAKQINDHWDEPKFVKATAEDAGNHGIVTMQIFLDMHGVKMPPIKVTWHFAPMMIHVLDMVTIGYNTCAAAIRQTRLHAGEAVKRDLLHTLERYEQ